MRPSRKWFLTGTALPALVLAGHAVARSPEGVPPRIELAQEEREERRGAPERAQPQRERPEPRPAARPEPKEERAAPPTARERPEPREAPSPQRVQERPSQERPAAAPERPGKPVAPPAGADRVQERREDARERREDTQERREDRQERREDLKDRREGVQERREDLKERRKDQKEPREDFQERREDKLERREDIQERREDRQQNIKDLRERREDQKGHREDLQERREDIRERREDQRERRDRFTAPGGPGYVPGGFRSDTVVIRDFGTVRRDRQRYDVDGRLYYREPGRIIVRDRNNLFIRHDENERFRTLYPRGGYRSERRGNQVYSYIDRPGGEQIVTVVDDDGRLLRRYRRYRDGREVMIINNRGVGPGRPVYEDVVDLPPPRIAMPRERYQVDYGRAERGAVYEALSAPPVQQLDRRYSLDQVRYSPQLRARMPSVDINTITFDSGAFEVTPDQGQQLEGIADAISRVVKNNPQEVFLIEGYTDAVGDDVDNLSLSDRRAQSVAQILTESFKVPPENLTTQGYGEQYLKVETEEPSRENRRVTVRRITPLLDQQAGSGGDRDDNPPPPR